MKKAMCGSVIRKQENAPMKSIVNNSYGKALRPIAAWTSAWALVCLFS